MPLFHRTTRETECIVHKLLESQQHAEEAVDDPTEDPEKTAHRRPPSSSHYHHDSPHRDSLATVQEAPDDCLESSGTSRRGGGDGMIEQQRDRNVDALGQPDEQAWKREMLQSVIPSSDVDTSDAPSKTARETLESRLLTKKQLSDMAWGVRELSRRLSSIRLKPKVRSLFILTKIYDRDLIPRTREIVRWLLSPERERRLTVYVEDRLKDDTQFNVDGIIGMAAEEYANRNGVEVTTARDKVAKQLRYWDADLCRTKPHSFDFIITLGGDGTVLYGGWLFQNIVPPVISFSLGSLGFMTKFDFSDFDTTLTTAFSQGVTVSLRLRFEGTIMRGVQKPSGEGVGVQGEENAHRRRDLVEELIGEEMGDERTHKPDGTYHVLNEIVVDRGPNPSTPYPILAHPPPFSCQLANIPYHSSIQYGALRRRRAPDFYSRRRCLRLHAYRLNSLQPCRGRLPLSPRKPHHARDSHCSPHALLPPHPPPRYDSLARRCALRLEDLLLGLLRRAREGRVASW